MFAPSNQLILASLRAFAQGETVKQWPDLDWEMLLTQAAHQRIIPVLLASLDKTALPESVRTRLEQATRQQRIRTALLVEAFTTINQAFAAAHIPVMPLKGMFLAHQVYPGVNLRYFDDIDLLVPPSAAQEAAAVMHQLGYIVHPQAQKPDWHHLAPFLHQKSKAVVELHTDLIRRARPGWDVAEIWARAERGRLAGVETWLINEQDALIHTALHARHSLYRRLTFFLDAHLQMAQLQTNGQVEEVITLAEAAGARVALAYLLQVGEKLWEGAAASLPAPHWRLQLTHRLASWDTLERRPNPPSEGPLPNLIELLLMDTWSHSLRMAYRLLFPPPQFLAQFYGSEQKHTYGRRFLTRTHRLARQLFGR